MTIFQFIAKKKKMFRKGLSILFSFIFNGCLVFWKKDQIKNVLLPQGAFNLL